MSLKAGHVGSSTRATATLIAAARPALDKAIVIGGVRSGLADEGACQRS